MTSAFHRLFAGIASAFVLLALVWGFLLVGSPGTGRSERFDDRRVSELQTIQNEILNIAYSGEPYAEGRVPKAIPANLDEVVAQALYQRPSIVDPETGMPYAYRVKSPTQYELCATFSFERDVSYDVRWNHRAGEQCFAFDVTQRAGEPKPLPATTPAIVEPQRK